MILKIIEKSYKTWNFDCFDSSSRREIKGNTRIQEYILRNNYSLRVDKKNHEAFEQVFICLLRLCHPVPVFCVHLQAPPFKIYFVAVWNTRRSTRCARKR